MPAAMLASFLYEHEYVRAGNTIARDIGLYASSHRLQLQRPASLAVLLTIPQYHTVHYLSIYFSVFAPLLGSCGPCSKCLR
jgi:hypothetical protein